MQVYAPTSGHTDTEVKMIYEEVSQTIQVNKTNYLIVMRDFNFKMGNRKEYFADNQKMQIMNIFYKKKYKRK